MIDPIWTFSLVIHSLTFACLSDGNSYRNLLLFTLVAIWGFRLGLHLLSRVSKTSEDSRYSELRKNWSTLKFFSFFIAQAISVGVLSISYFMVSVNKRDFSKLDLLAAALFLAFVFFEWLSDLQLKKFKESNPGQLCTVGLYRYSRHPNYFFECMTWWVFPILAWNTPFWFISIVPAVMIFLMIYYATGIPPLEKSASEKYGEVFKNYCNTTSKFVPWVKKI